MLKYEIDLQINLINMQFHSAHTITMGMMLGILTLWSLWVKKGDRFQNFQLASIFASIFWITQLGAVLFPNTALFDPEFLPVDFCH